MSANTSIEWTDRTWNPLIASLAVEIRVKLKKGGERVFPVGTRGWFCTKCSEGCANCYAEKINFRLGNGLSYSLQKLDAIQWGLHDVLAPLRWKKPGRVFVNSMTDLFHDAVPVQIIDMIMAVIATDRGGQTFQILTKRAKRMRDYFADPALKARLVALAKLLKLLEFIAELREWPLRNLWLGVSVENQARANERIPHLLETPAAVRFLSCEPLLGPLNLHSDHIKVESWKVGERFDGPRPLEGLHWVIAGGESGPKARPMHPEWARSLRDQCAAADVPFLFKQWGEYRPAVMKEMDGDISFPSVDCPGARLHQFPDGTDMLRIGKKAAGRVLEGIEHNAFPCGYERSRA